jgi:hypothetical protein
MTNPIDLFNSDFIRGENIVTFDPIDCNFTQFITHDDYVLITKNIATNHENCDETDFKLKIIFVIDPNYCNFLNQHNKIVGRIKLKDSNLEIWEFESNISDLKLELKSKYPYDGEREVIRYLIENNLVDIYVNFGGEIK